MVTCTVHEPPRPAADRMDRAENLVFLKDGFSWSAALFAPIWLLVHRLWWPLLGYIILSGLFEALRLGTDLEPSWITLAGITLHLLVGFEAYSLRLWSLERRGWHVLGSVSGGTFAECERRFFEAWLPRQPVIAQPASPSPSSTGTIPAPRTTPVIGSLLGVRS
jgi:hypothetical protein